jgi:hypothetical protein
MRRARPAAIVEIALRLKYRATMPSFESSRSTVIVAPPAVVHALVTDFRAWPKWSPWEELDADLRREYGGAESGVGARYRWEGKKAGAGSMAITQSSAERIDIDLDFEKPIKANNKVVFRFEPRGSATHVTWTMSGNRGLFLAVMGKLFFDGMVGKDFEKGLAKLKDAAEASAS